MAEKLEPSDLSSEMLPRLEIQSLIHNIAHTKKILDTAHQHGLDLNDFHGVLSNTLGEVQDKLKEKAERLKKSIEENLSKEKAEQFWEDFQDWLQDLEKNSKGSKLKKT